MRIILLISEALPLASISSLANNFDIRSAGSLVPVQIMQAIFSNSNSYRFSFTLPVVDPYLISFRKKKF